MSANVKLFSDSTIVCNVSSLIDTRMLVQANSGGGKSWAVRKILEATHGMVQHIVLDPEGEFASLREKLDYVHAAAVGGDTVVHPRSAGLLAERILELGVSTIVDLYELKAPDRVRFVRLFLDALVNAPKKLWHPALVVVDEAHVYCPQNGQAESAGSVIDLCSRGRKRGFAALLATQRIQKLHKDAAAELNNKLIGRTTLDVDLSRAGDELGFPKARWNELRQLSPGQFFVVGPAFGVRGATQVQVGRVLTTHPKAGSRIAFVAPPPTSKIRALLPKLSDLPAEAEQRAQTFAELKAEIAKLKTELSRTQRSVPAPKVVEKTVYRTAVPPGVKKAMESAKFALLTAVDLVSKYDEVKPHAATLPSRPAAGEVRVLRKQVSEILATSSRLGAGERTVLRAIAQHGDAGVDREQLSVLTGYKRSTRDAYIQRLRTGGYIEDGSMIRANLSGIAMLGDDFEPLPTGSALRDYWLTKLPEGERRVFECALDAYPDAVLRDRISDTTDYKRSTRDAYIQRLSSRKLVVTTRDGIKASPRLYT